jgi:Fur family peroxide stress response transcriptional regulator
MGRNTVQRQIILAGLRRLDTHPTIEEVYAEIKKEHPSISKTTVYRNLRQLAKDDIIRQVLLPDGLERYDKHNTKHHHINR